MISIVTLFCLPLGIALFFRLYNSSVSNDNITTGYQNSDNIMQKSPVIALSHGGPTFMYNDGGIGGDKGAFQCTRKIGRYIEEVIKPRFIIYVSAHWKSTAGNKVEVGVPTLEKFAIQGPPMENSLIYDFYGFPKHFYDEQFHSMNDMSVASQVVEDLNFYFSESDTLLSASLTKRGIDHGAWVPLKVAFPDKINGYWNTEIPIIQVSLTSRDSDFDTHYKLGQALSKYRSADGLIIVSGMSVHNLRDMSTVEPMPYTKEFNDVLKGILTGDGEKDKLYELKQLLIDPEKRKLLFSAHPTLDHFVPFVVGLGAGESDKSGNCHVEELYNNEQGSLGWGIYQYD